MIMYSVIVDESGQAALRMHIDGHEAVLLSYERVALASRVERIDFDFFSDADGAWKCLKKTRRVDEQTLELIRDFLQFKAKDDELERIRTIQRLAEAMDMGEDELVQWYHVPLPKKRFPSIEKFNVIIAQQSSESLERLEKVLQMALEAQELKGDGIEVFVRRYFEEAAKLPAHVERPVKNDSSRRLWPFGRP